MTHPDPAICHSSSHAAAGLEAVLWVEWMCLVALMLIAAVVLKAEDLMIDPFATLHRLALSNCRPSRCHGRCHAVVGLQSHCCVVLGISFGVVVVGPIPPHIHGRPRSEGR